MTPLYASMRQGGLLDDRPPEMHDTPYIVNNFGCESSRSCVYFSGVDRYPAPAHGGELVRVYAAPSVGESVGR